MLGGLGRAGQRWLQRGVMSHTALGQFRPEQFVPGNFLRTGDGFCALLPVSLRFFHTFRGYLCILFWKDCIVLPYQLRRRAGFGLFFSPMCKKSTKFKRCH